MTRAVDIAPRLLALRAIQVRRSGGQSPTGPLGDCHQHFQIAHQFFCWGGRWFGLWLPLRFQKQLGLRENALASFARAIAPAGVQLRGLSGIAMEFGERRSHLPAVLQTHARHGCEKLHRHVRGDLAVAHLLLNDFGQQFDQRQPPRYPTYAAIKTARQFIETIAEALFQLGQQPALLQSRLVRGVAQRTVQHQSLSLTHWPEQSMHSVAAQLLERRDALEAVNHQVSVGLIRHGYDNDGRLLAEGGQRSQQSLLLDQMVYPQMFPSPVELVKLQLHGAFPLPTMEEAASDLVIQIASVRW
jgi:hypothetical protein